ncbi:hypothetical protein DOY81_009040 [Sarcophaga bullata]|nr:hypothetical protein DOY81_009040 [Sarcophaga bullata]
MNVEKWQKAVHNDPKDCLTWCKQLQVVPDLLSGVPGRVRPL